MKNRDYVPQRLSLPDPTKPAQYNREQKERRMLSRGATSVVKPFGDQVQERIDQKKTAIRENARRKIAEIAANATAAIDALDAPKRKAKR